MRLVDVQAMLPSTVPTAHALLHHIPAADSTARLKTFDAQTLTVPAGTKRLFIEPDSSPPALGPSPPPSLSVDYPIPLEPAPGFPAENYRKRYVVTALDGSDESLASMEVAVYANVYKPAAEGGSATLAAVRLTWTAVPGATGYNIYRTEEVPGPAVPLQFLATVGPTATTFTDNGSITPGSAVPPEVRPWNVIGGIEMEGGPPPQGYDLFVERLLCTDEWNETQVVSSDGTQPGGAEWMAGPESALQQASQIYVLVWPDSHAPNGTQIRCSCPERSRESLVDHNGLLGAEIRYMAQSLALQLVYEDGFWRESKRPYA